MAKELDEFIRAATTVGQSRENIVKVLTQAGWPESTIKETTGKFHFAESFPLAVPRPGSFASPRISVLNIFSFILLYTLIYIVVGILFSVLDHYLPDGLGRYGIGYYYAENLADAIRDDFAILIVALPCFLGVEKARLKASLRLQQAMPRLRLWLINLTSLVGWLVLFSMACGTVRYFLDGELGLRFLIKLAILATIVAGSNLYYRLEVRKAEEVA
ncbi:MAG: DUF5671 domain-containing protein [Bdellovibrionales bacterium]